MYFIPEKIELCRQAVSSDHPSFRVVPLSLVFIKAGTVLQELTDLGVTSLASFSTLIILAGLSLLPLVFRNQLREAFL
ncbi:uncharacterized protein DC041_0006683 [Schistosoma bovis]|uniref:Uncharacterized protein n=1 Tax=Schistosoma bovis TaxID=6184 RepID=A0A430QCC2_SCHBO|nr:uncharacterized protein DC041_0006683 [Schistosoma bovis]